jgi:hypothetical protein
MNAQMNDAPKAPPHRLRSFLLNYGLESEPPPEGLAPLAAKLGEIVVNNGGQFCSSLGPFELKILPATDYAIIGLKLEGGSLAMAMLAWEQFTQDALWEELLKWHKHLVRNFRPPVELVSSPPPGGLPWLGISMSPPFLAEAAPSALALVLAVLWSTAYAMLEHHRTAAVSN